ncbi:MAG TPA: hypothetical protein VNT51_01465 [Miltoncostaeaceae bacterium]|nr:hypothetical protein [Miltoncostaeaceae bacterium]
MAELNEVVGAVLRDLAAARVIGDMFARDASATYRADPVMASFPVPRIDIAEASIQLAFAITAITPPVVDPPQIAVGLAPQLAERLARLVVDELLTSPRGASIAEHLDGQGVDLVAVLADALADAMRGDPDAVVAAEQGVADRLRGSVAPVLRQQLKDTGVEAILAQRVTVQRIREGVREASKRSLGQLATRIRGRELAAQELEEAVAEAAEGFVEEIRTDLADVAPRPEQARARLATLSQEVAEVFRNGLAAVPVDQLPGVLNGTHPLRRQFDAALWTPLTQDQELAAALAGLRAEERQTLLDAPVSGWLTEVRNRLRAAIMSVEEQAPTVNVAVTAGELEGVPAERISRVAITAGMSNYQWIAGDDDRPRLVRE